MRQACIVVLSTDVPPYIYVSGLSPLLSIKFIPSKGSSGARIITLNMDWPRPSNVTLGQVITIQFVEMLFCTEMLFAR